MNRPASSDAAGLEGYVESTFAELLRKEPLAPAFKAGAVRALEVLPRRPMPLCQYEILLVAHPLMQSGGSRRVKTMPESAGQGWLTVDVYGTVRGNVIEDMRVEAGGVDIESLLPDQILEEITHYVVSES